MFLSRSFRNSASRTTNTTTTPTTTPSTPPTQKQTSVTFEETPAQNASPPQPARKFSLTRRLSQLRLSLFSSETDGIDGTEVIPNTTWSILPNAPTTTTTFPALPPDTYFLSSTSTHSFALTQRGELYARGQNQHLLPSFLAIYRHVGHDALDSKRFTSIATASRHAVAVTNDGVALVWGSDGLSSKPRLPTAVPSPLRREKVTQVVCCEDSITFLTTLGQVWSWAMSSSPDTCQTLGRKPVLGASTKASLIPALITDALDGLFVTQLFAGPRRVFAIDANGSLFWWGVSFSGNSTTIQHVPLRVEQSFGSTIVSLSCSTKHAAMVLSSGEVFTCGRVDEDNGCLGRDVIHSDSADMFAPIQAKLLSFTPILVVCGEGFTTVCSAGGQLAGFGAQACFPVNATTTTGTIANMFEWSQPTSGREPGQQVGGLFNVDGYSLVLDFPTPASLATFSINTRRRLTPPTMDKLLQACAAVSNPSSSSLDLRVAVLELFHISSLNGAFCRPCGNQQDAATAPGDHQTVYLTFETLRIAMSKRPANMKWLQERFDELFMTLAAFAPQVQHVGQLRVFWLAFLMGAENQSKLLASTTGLRDSMMSILCSWLTSTSVASTGGGGGPTTTDTFFMSKILKPLVRSVETSLLGSRKATEWPTGAVRMLAFLHVRLFGTTTSSAITSSIIIPPPSSFYVHPKWDQQELLEKWVGFLQERRRRGGSFSALEVDAIAGASSTLVPSLFAYPFLVDSETKMEIIHLENSLQQQLQVAIFAAIAPTGSPFLEIQVSRERLLQDTTRILLNARKTDLSKPIRVVFFSEPGVDGGGLRREWAQLLAQELFTNGQLFEVHPSGEGETLFLNRKSEFARRVKKESERRRKAIHAAAPTTTAQPQRGGGHGMETSDNAALSLAGGVVYLNEADFFRQGGDGSGNGGGRLTWNTCSGHGQAFVSFFTPNDGFTCDLCKRNLPENAAAWGCRQCNQDVCEDCHRKGEAEAAATALTTAAVEDPIQVAEKAELKLNEDARKHVVLTGVFMGLCVYNNVLLDVRFSPVLLRALLEGATRPIFLQSVSLRDLELVDEDLARGLKSMLQYEANDFDDVFGSQTFTDGEGEELVPGGKDMCVTKENRATYVEERVRHEVRDGCVYLIEALVEGFQAVVRHGNVALEMMSVDEFGLMLCGVPELDVEALRKSAKYEGYDENSPVIKWLWEILEALKEEELQRFLAFTTGAKRAPMGGLSKLVLLVQKAGPDSDELPSSHVCFNTLLLPNYGTKDKMEAKLRLALENAEGFGLR